MKESDIAKRIDLLEAAVFKKNGKIGRNIFDEYSDKIHELDVDLKTQAMKLNDKLQSNMTAYEERFFNVDNSVKRVLEKS
jgi:hypothetical protein